MRYSFYPDSSVGAVPGDATAIHLVRPAKKEKLSELLRKRNIKEIFLSDSCRKRIPSKTIIFLKKSNIALVSEKRKGRPLGLEMNEMLKVISLQRDDKSYRKIESLTGIPKSTTHYLVKYAERGKIRNGSQIIYLK